MKPKQAVAAIIGGLVFIVAGFAESTLPEKHVWLLLATGMMVTGLVFMSAGFIALAWASSE